MIKQVVQTSIFVSTYNPTSSESPASTATTVLLSATSPFSALTSLTETYLLPGVENTQQGGGAEAYIVRYVNAEGSVWLPAPTGGIPCVTVSDGYAVTFGVWAEPWIGVANAVAATAVGTIFVES